MPCVTLRGPTVTAETRWHHHPHGGHRPPFISTLNYFLVFYYKMDVHKCFCTVSGKGREWNAFVLNLYLQYCLVTWMAGWKIMGFRINSLCFFFLFVGGEIGIWVPQRFTKYYIRCLYRILYSWFHEYVFFLFFRIKLHSKSAQFHKRWPFFLGLKDDHYVIMFQRDL